MTSHPFQPFDTRSPLELEERLRLVPKDALVKGLFLQRIADEAKKLSGKPIREAKYVPFKDYPFTEWMQLIVDGGLAAYPRVPPREALRRLGHGTFATYRESTLGKVVLSVAGNSIGATIPLVPKLYALTSARGTRVVIAHNEPGHCVVEMHDAWDFPDSYHVGVLEGGFLALGHTVDVRVGTITRSRCDIEFRYAR